LFDISGNQTAVTVNFNHHQEEEPQNIIDQINQNILQGIDIGKLDEFYTEKPVKETQIKWTTKPKETPLCL
jgi:hypothetical protein